MDVTLGVWGCKPPNFLWGVGQVFWSPNFARIGYFSGDVITHFCAVSYVHELYWYLSLSRQITINYKGAKVTSESFYSSVNHVWVAMELQDLQKGILHHKKPIHSAKWAWRLPPDSAWTLNFWANDTNHEKICFRSTFFITSTQCLNWPRSWNVTLITLNWLWASQLEISVLEEWA